MKKIIQLTIICCIALITISCSKTITPTNIEFDQFIETIIPEYLSAEDPNIPFLFANPQSVGLTTEMPDYSLPTYHKYLKMVEKDQLLLTKIQKYDYKKLSDSQEITYDVIVYQLKNSIDSLNYYYYDAGELGTFLGTNCDLPYIFIAWPLFSQNSLDQMIDVLNNLPATFQSYIDFERERIKQGLPRLKNIYQGIIDQAKAVVKEKDDYFLYKTLIDRIAEVKQLSPTQIQSYQKLITQGIKNGLMPAYQKLIDQLTPILTQAEPDRNKTTLSNYPKGKQYYQYLLASNVGVDTSYDKLYNYLENKLSNLAKQLQKLYQIDPNPSEDTNKVEDINELIYMLAENSEKDFPPISIPKYNLVEVDKSLQDNFSPAAYFTPALDSDYPNLVLMNPANKDDSSIAKTIAHETFPGHMYQFNYVKESDLPMIRKIISITGYSEGWGKYADHYARLFPELTEYYPAELYSVNEDFVYTLWALIDVGIHTANMTTNDVHQLFKGYFSDSITLEDVYYYFDIVNENPTNMVQYYYSYFLLEDYKQEFKKQMGSKYSDLLFHTKVLEIGSVPFPILHKYLKQIK